jgi:tRNA modification GTPase
MQINDTIAAMSSAPGHGGRAIVRLSGLEAWNLTLCLLEARPANLPPRRWIDVRLKYEAIPAGLILFSKPHSFTGQDMAELHIPGIPVLARSLLADLLRAGARSAGPGEFSYRACELGKMDISRAEGINAVIHAQSEHEFAAASALRCGELYRWAMRQSTQIGELLALVEAGIDFTDEHDVGVITGEELGVRAAALQRELAELQFHNRRWRRAEHYPIAVLVGRPNAGKSSLFNALLRMPRAMVSPHAGTTRDSISALLRTPSGVVTLVDSAGLETCESLLHTSMNQMREHTIDRADVVIWVSESGDDFPKTTSSAAAAVLCVRSKADIAGGRSRDGEWLVSSVTGEGIGKLRDQIGQLVLAKPSAAGSRVMLNERHIRQLEIADSALARIIDAPHRVETEPELIAADLRAALDAVGQITGTVSSDAILGLIFSHFCIGK